MSVKLLRKIRIFTDWCDSKQAKQECEKIYNLIDNPKYGVEFILTDGDDYTHCVIFNTCFPEITVPKTNVIGFAQEPMQFLETTDRFINYARKNISKYYIGEKASLPEPFIQHHGFMWRLPLLKHVPAKTSLISFAVSHKQYAPGHKYRHTLVQAILETQLPIDIWGIGTKFYKSGGDERVKSEFSATEVPRIYEPYKFNIAIENYSGPEYISEKILNCLVSSTVPIYWGSANIKNHLNDGNVILLSKEDNGEEKIKHDIKLLTQICVEPDKYYNPIALNDPKLDKLINLFDFFENEMNE